MEPARLQCEPRPGTGGSPPTPRVHARTDGWVGCSPDPISTTAAPALPWPHRMHPPSPPYPSRQRPTTACGGGVLWRWWRWPPPPPQGERQAVNTVCQGSAADLVKSAMVKLQAELEAPPFAGNTRMVLQVRPRHPRPPFTGTPPWCGAGVCAAGLAMTQAHASVHPLPQCMHVRAHTQPLCYRTQTRKHTPTTAAAAGADARRAGV